MLSKEEYGEISRMCKTLIQMVNDGEVKLEKALSCLNEAINSKRAVEVFPVTVDYNRSLAEMIELGEYDWKHVEIIEKNFPVKGKGKSDINLVLVYFNKSIDSDDVFYELDEMELRPATLPELLSFGVKYPEKQGEFPIAALGSHWNISVENSYVVYLDKIVSKRCLKMNYLSGDWMKHYRFLAAPKQTPLLAT
ncbi:hypothetical protein K8R32_01815 [bacterium]|nr:hypothetical protein [bacterium]